MHTEGFYDEECSDIIRQDVPTENEPLEMDSRTPDRNIARDDRLIRNVKHPMNAEAPLTLLYESGFITPHQLHYVRSHGYTPDLSQQEADEWKIRVEGLVENPQEISLREIMNLEKTTLPVTLVCSGNRRREQNLIRKSSGFDWGPAAVSNSLWTGTLVKNLLELLKVKPGAQYVHFEGAETLPKGQYATHLPIGVVMDYQCAIMIAWKQNGLPLAPDHGRPCRIIMPGMIGARSIKWLKKIVVSDKKINNYYQFHDNRVLPTMVSVEEAKKDERWWHIDDYSLWNYNLNSVFVYPEHNELLRKTTSEKDVYKLRGFAQNGGGIRVGRVEISLDRGYNWRLAKMRHPEDDYRKFGIKELFGGKMDFENRYKTFSWCFWSLEVQIEDLFNSKDILVRAMDMNNMPQPRDIYLNVMGMLTNSWYRVAILDEGDKIRFQHPTHIHSDDGWMDRVRRRGGNLLSPSWGEENWSEPKEVHLPPESKEVSMIREDKKDVIITQEEFKKHTDSDNPWFVINGQVYDGTPFLEKHPGGSASITSVAGQDVTDDYLSIHSDYAKKIEREFHLGKLEETSHETKETLEQDDDEDIGDNFLSPKKWKKAKLIKRMEISSNVRIFDFSLEAPDQVLGLPVGKHIFLRHKDSGNQQVIRAYTPISDPQRKGILRLLVKIYFPTEHKPGGRMGTLLEHLRLQDNIEVKGPMGDFEYLGNGNCRYKGNSFRTKKFFMVAGGTGITPCYQVLNQVTKDHNEIEATVLYGNQNKQDILCQRDLFRFESSGRVHLQFWLASPPENWKGRIGFITHEDLSAIINSSSSVLLVCGPPGLVRSVKSWVAKSGYDQGRCIFF